MLASSSHLKISLVQEDFEIRACQSGKNLWGTTDAGIDGLSPKSLGSKGFVQKVFDGVKHLLGSKDERKFTPVAGVKGMYLMKKLRV